jgi:MtfA peptidase
MTRVHVLDFLFPKAHRAKLRAQRLPPAWRSLVETRVSYFKLLTPDEQAALEGHINVFLDEKSFEGCGGLELTDEIRLTIAAQACLLLLGMQEPHYFPACDVILVYPGAHLAPTKKGLVVSEAGEARLGESHQDGVVVLSWESVREGAANHRDGHNVVLHEFAHQLDQEDGAADGAPRLSRPANYGLWAHVLGDEFEALKQAIEDHRRSDIDTYGATNPAEFFAVVTEAFFEQPTKLRARHPQLYEQLSRYYRQDPAARLGKRSPP